MGRILYLHSVKGREHVPRQVKIVCGSRGEIDLLYASMFGFELHHNIVLMLHAIILNIDQSIRQSYMDIRVTLEKQNIFVSHNRYRYIGKCPLCSI
ncbi:hypothetical protein GDO81_006466 [Engystomops pustulosus]|uniref:Uncharacterized protein n=1 Tax=Engystomops pustulosus TaxID=76066 RepID=A0AAV7CWU7_ENGPU|nr:hypothetical protein GDO81_006466 [Engystomops pustulosus]